MRWRSNRGLGLFISSGVSKAGPLSPRVFEGTDWRATRRWLCMFFWQLGVSFTFRIFCGGQTVSPHTTTGLGPMMAGCYRNFVRVPGNVGAAARVDGVAALGMGGPLA